MVVPNLLFYEVNGYKSLLIISKCSQCQLISSKIAKQIVHAVSVVHKLGKTTTTLQLTPTFSGWRFSSSSSSLHLSIIRLFKEPANCDMRHTVAIVR